MDGVKIVTARSSEQSLAARERQKERLIRDTRVNRQSGNGKSSERDSGEKSSASVCNASVSTSSSGTCSTGTASSDAASSVASARNQPGSELLHTLAAGTEANRTPLRETHAFLIKAGVLLHKYGTPSHRLERVMVEVAKPLGVDGTFLYTPTALVFSLRDDVGEETYVRRVDSGAVEIDKLIRFDEVLEEVEAGTLTLREASLRLDEIADAHPPFAAWLTVLACAVSSCAVAVFFRGSPEEVAVSGVIGLLIALIGQLSSKMNWETGLLEPVAGFLSAVGALAISQFVMPLDDRLVTLAALIIMIPGLTITVALTELAVGHLSAGVARLAGGCVSLLTLTIGVALAWRLAGHWRNLPETVLTAAQHPLDQPWYWAAIFLAPLCFSIVFRARLAQWPVILLVSVSGFLSSLLAGETWGLETGAFIGAMTVGVGSNFYARVKNRPALVPLTPGIIVLVPGSLGYRSLTAFLDHETLAGVDFAFSMVVVAAALVGGILMANLLLPPKRIL